MRRKIQNTALILLAMVIVISCEKKIITVADYNTTSGKAYIRIIHASPNFRAVFNRPDSFNIFSGNEKINGTFFTYNSAFPATTLNNNTYSAIEAKTHLLRLTVNGRNTPDSINIINTSRVLLPNNYYTWIITDSLNNPSDNSRIFVQDNLQILPPDSTYSVRFIHAILNDTAGRTVDVYSFRRMTNIFTNINRGVSTNFLEIPYSITNDTLSIRRSGTNFELARINNIAFNNRRIYTILFRGNISVTSGTKARGGFVYNNY